MANHKSEYYGPEYPARLDRERMAIENLRGKERGEDWSIGAGDYNWAFDKDREVIFPTQRRNPFDLLGSEVLLHRMVECTLEDSTTRSPHIILDFGGAFGSSWCRLAKWFEKDVDTGRLLFVVSNVNFDVEASLNDARKTQGYLPSQLEAVRQNYRRVQYIPLDTLTLVEGSPIVRSLNREIPVKGNVSLFHESDALMHSFIPDASLGTMGEILSKSGLLLYTSTRFSNSNAPDMISNPLSELVDRAHESGRELLVRSSLNSLDFPHTCRYIAYGKRNTFRPDMKYPAIQLLPDSKPFEG